MIFDEFFCELSADVNFSKKNECYIMFWINYERVKEWCLVIYERVKEW